MLALPEYRVARDKKYEARLNAQMRSWIEKGERAEGLHASDLMDPRRAYWQRKSPKRITTRLTWIFAIGRVLHELVISAYRGLVGGYDPQGRPTSDEGSRWSESLGIWYSPDILEEDDGTPTEFKTTRSFYKPKNTKDLDLYTEQLLIYLVGERKLSGRIAALYMNLRDKRRRTRPRLLAYRVQITEEQRAAYEREICATVAALNAALKTGDPSKLPLCRPFKCGKHECEWWNECKPPGRYGVPEKKWEV